MRPQPIALRAASVLLLAVTLSSCSLGARAEHGDAAFCTYLNETPVEDFARLVFTPFGGGLVFQRDIVDGRLRALSISVLKNIREERMTVEVGRNQLLDRCRAIRAL